MIIDAHAHLSAPAELYAYKAVLLSSRGSHGRGGVKVSDDQLRAAVETDKQGRHTAHMEYIDQLGTDMQAVSPRPYQLMHSEKPAKIVQWFAEECNNLIHRQTQIFPDRFFGIAGLPQPAGEPIGTAVNELVRCVTELGFKGCLLNPDPYENTGVQPPAMGDKYWYPLYEKLCELDVPAHIHGTGSRADREPYTLQFINEETTTVFGLVNSSVFEDFPSLKIIVSHGGGAMPFQIGRFEAGTIRKGAKDPAQLFSSRMKKLYYDTVLYTPEAVEFLIKVIGPERCLFGSECPGTGSQIDPRTGRPLDDVAPSIKAISWLSDADKDKVLAGNAVRLFKLDAKAATKGKAKAAE